MSARTEARPHRVCVQDLDRYVTHAQLLITAVYLSPQLASHLVFGTRRLIIMCPIHAFSLSQR